MLEAIDEGEDPRYLIQKKYNTLPGEPRLSNQSSKNEDSSMITIN